MKLRTEGIEALAEMMARRGQTSRETVTRMLKAGGERIAAAARASAEGYGLVDTGKLVRSIRAGQVRVYSDSASVEIQPQGSANRHGHTERNAVVGFVQHYGRSYGHTQRAGRGFFDDAVANAGDAAVEEMIGIWREEGAE